MLTLGKGIIYFFLSWWRAWSVIWVKSHWSPEEDNSMEERRAIVGRLLHAVVSPRHDEAWTRAMLLRMGGRKFWETFQRHLGSDETEGGVKVRPYLEWHSGWESPDWDGTRKERQTDEEISLGPVELGTLAYICRAIKSCRGHGSSWIAFVSRRNCFAIQSTFLFVLKPELGTFLDLEATLESVVQLRICQPIVGLLLLLFI